MPSQSPLTPVNVLGSLARALDIEVENACFIQVSGLHANHYTCKWLQILIITLEEDISL